MKSDFDSGFAPSRMRTNIMMTKFEESSPSYHKSQATGSFTLLSIKIKN